MRILFVLSFSISLESIADAAETFVNIQQVSGNRIAVVVQAGGAGGRGREGGGRAGAAQSTGRGRGRFARGGASTQPTVLVVPATAKITSAMRERRTFEFRIGAELAGGLRHRIFRTMKEPLSARIVHEGSVIKEVNVITDTTDINQSNTTAGGQTVIAVRPKRPPLKR